MDLRWPDTGRTVKYEFEVSNVTMAPDGFSRSMMVVNGQYPGPLVEADWGDIIEVTVTNSLDLNGTSIHWHGLRQLGSNEMDGTPGVTECPIPPGGKKVYRFRATQYGTSWYHSHYSVQYGNGIMGPLIIHGPSTKNYDIDLGILPFTDWYYAPVFTLNAVALHARGPPTADNMLINGSMTSSYGGKYAVTTLTPGKTHRLRLANTGINSWVHVSLDGHDFTVIAADFVPVVPFTTKSLSLSVGQRYDVLIDANQDIGNYWLRVGTGGACDGPNTNAANIRSIFRYEGAYQEDPYSQASSPLPQGCYDEPNIVPFVPTQVPQQFPEELTLGFTNTAVAPGLVQWLINGTPMKVNLSRPTLQHIYDGGETFDLKENAFNIGQAQKFQYWVIQQGPDIPAALPHPIHLHGHDFFVLASAMNATWSGDISGLNFDNPPRRDTATLPARGYLVVAFESDNPGAWLMHCHIPFHVAAGFGFQFIERRGEILGHIGELDTQKDECGQWASFEKEFYPNGFELGDSLV
ncbi:multicopper oxidase [Lentithecium fluviatile CBS 122367]|uniref:Multicopper oxidase n=1 Tax=Lentithecium fluviatile CBS 122367 TaxID=1168545 RepID=A0A6G1J0H4_9PLEO|nr:multicopper oxidase [Lentithecium fluviatile CBS 122367]